MQKFLAHLVGGTTDYAIDIFHAALKRERFTCFLAEDEPLPMLYMDDAVRATLELMEAPSSAISERGSYNLGGVSFTPCEIAQEIRKYLPDFEIVPSMTAARGATGTGRRGTTFRRLSATC